jgi:PKD repeat protein
MTRISSLDSGYVTGQLSLYPEALDDRSDLYQATNNADTTLKQTLTYNGRTIVVDDASKFPSSGLLRVGIPNNYNPAPELIYYGERTNTVFGDLIRGFAGSSPNAWPAFITTVSNSVMAEHHNAVKDALINVETNLGIQDFPVATSLNGLLQTLETTHLAPKAAFRAYPLQGVPPLTVSFQNFSNQHVVRSSWDFGDGTTSLDRNPHHVYTAEGIYTVKLNIITMTGTQGITIKNNYITVSEDKVIPFAYWTNTSGNTYAFVDQTDGDIVQRFWSFGDGDALNETDSNAHSASHTYTTAGTYSPVLVVVFANQTYKRLFLDTITVS